MNLKFESGKGEKDNLIIRDTNILQRVSLFWNLFCVQFRFNFHPLHQPWTAIDNFLLVFISLDSTHFVIFIFVQFCFVVFDDRICIQIHCILWPKRAMQLCESMMRKEVTRGRGRSHSQCVATKQGVKIKNGINTRGQSHVEAWLLLCS